MPVESGRRVLFELGYYRTLGLWLEFKIMKALEPNVADDHKNKR